MSVSLLGLGLACILQHCSRDPEAMRNETGDGLTNPLPNKTGVRVGLCSAVRGYPVIPRNCTHLRAVRRGYHAAGSN